MQLDQLEKAVLTSEMFVWASDTMLLSANAFCRLLANIPVTPPLKLLAIATSMEGISTQCKCALPKNLYNSEACLDSRPGEVAFLGLRLGEFRAVTTVTVPYCSLRSMNIMCV